MLWVFFALVHMWDDLTCFERFLRHDTVLHDGRYAACTYRKWEIDIPLGWEIRFWLDVGDGVTATERTFGTDGRYNTDMASRWPWTSHWCGLVLAAGEYLYRALSKIRSNRWFRHQLRWMSLRRIARIDVLRVPLIWSSLISKADRWRFAYPTEDKKIRMSTFLWFGVDLTASIQCRPSSIWRMYRVKFTSVVSISTLC